MPSTTLDATPTESGLTPTGERQGAPASAMQPVLRRFPYPYRALLAVCSDLDETPDRAAYFETARFLNTTGQTSIGRGVGLEIGNTIYFDMPSSQFAYWNTDDAGRDMVRALIRSGHIDCLHSFGDLATTRAHAARALDELQRHGCQLRVWIDHATAITNFGSDIMRGVGDVPGSEAFHADLTVPFGIRYVSRGRVTSVIGQNTRRLLGGIYSSAAPLRSIRTVVKEAAKGVVARAGSTKYAMHSVNELLSDAQLRSGQPVSEFIRCNPHWLGIETGDTADGVAEVLDRRFLDALVEREGSCILYTHLGKSRDRSRPLPPRACEAFATLANRHVAGDVLVTTTRRALDFSQMLRQARVEQIREGEWTHLHVCSGANDGGGQSFDGLTFYVADPMRTRVFVDGRERADVQPNGPDHSGSPSVSIPWTRLEFPSL